MPVYGTAAHSWVLSFCGETEAFRKLQHTLGTSTVQLVDTYDTLEGVKKVAAMGQPLWGIRLDSGDFLNAFPRGARHPGPGRPAATPRSWLSGDLDEYRIRDLVAAGAPMDAFGVGTQLATSADAPAMGAIYKLVELDMAAASSASPPNTARTRPRCPAPSRSSASTATMCWRAPANAATARRCCVRCCWAGNWSSRCPT